MGLCNSFLSLGRIVGPIWAGAIFDVNERYPYISGSAIMLVGFVISLIWVSQGRGRQGKRGGVEAAVAQFRDS
jgi:DHA1 family multidrug resistance protein-like MFS transporter